MEQLATQYGLAEANEFEKTGVTNHVKGTRT